MTRMVLFYRQLRSGEDYGEFGEFGGDGDVGEDSEDDGRLESL